MGDTQWNLNNNRINPRVIAGRTVRVDAPTFNPGYSVNDEIGFDPDQPVAAVIPVGGGESAGENYRDYVDLAANWKHEAIIPIMLGKHNTGWRDGVDLADTVWPYRVIGLTVYSDPAHPTYQTTVDVAPGLASNAMGNFTPESSQSEIVLVDVASALPPGVVDGPYGDAYGLIGPNFHA